MLLHSGHHANQADTFTPILFTVFSSEPARQACAYQNRGRCGSPGATHPADRRHGRQHESAAQAVAPPADRKPLIALWPWHPHQTVEIRLRPQGTSRLAAETRLQALQPNQQVSKRYALSIASIFRVAPALVRLHFLHSNRMRNAGCPGGPPPAPAKHATNAVQATLRSPPIQFQLFISSQLLPDTVRVRTDSPVAPKAMALSTLRRSKFSVSVLSFATLQRTHIHCS